MFICIILGIYIKFCSRTILTKQIGMNEPLNVALRYLMNFQIFLNLVGAGTVLGKKQGKNAPELVCLLLTLLV
jgi:hypothetical protein